MTKRTLSLAAWLVSTSAMQPGIGCWRSFRPLGEVVGEFTVKTGRGGLDQFDVGLAGGRDG